MTSHGGHRKCETFFTPILAEENIAGSVSVNGLISSAVAVTEEIP